MWEFVQSEFLVTEFVQSEILVREFVQSQFFSVGICTICFCSVSNLSAGTPGPGPARPPAAAAGTAAPRPPLLPRRPAEPRPPLGALGRVPPCPGGSGRDSGPPQLSPDVPHCPPVPLVVPLSLVVPCYPPVPRCGGPAAPAGRALSPPRGWRRYRSSELRPPVPAGSAVTSLFHHSLCFFTLFCSDLRFLHLLDLAPSLYLCVLGGAGPGPAALPTGRATTPCSPKAGWVSPGVAAEGRGGMSRASHLAFPSCD